MSLLDKNDPRTALDQLIRERGEDYASLSRMLGRNAAYIQQFIKRGVPRKLDEVDRRTLSRYFGVPEQMLGGPPDESLKIVGGKALSSAKHGSDLVQVPFINAQASAGHGAIAVDERVSARIAFRGDWLRELAGGGNPTGLSVIQVKGDSMIPTLSDGDDILVDRNDVADRLRDGIYVLRIVDMLNVKRIAVNPKGGFDVRSDNPAYPTWASCDPESVTIIGRVVWAGRRIS